MNAAEKQKKIKKSCDHIEEKKRHESPSFIVIIYVNKHTH